MFYPWTVSDVASARNPPRRMRSSQKPGRAASRQPIDVDSRSDDDEDDDAFPARNPPRRKRSSQKPGHAASQPIEIGSSDDDDDDDSVTMTVRCVGTSLFLSALNIGTRIYRLFFCS